MHAGPGRPRGSGTIDFTDVDLADLHTVSGDSAGGCAPGTFSVSVSDDSTGDGAGACQLGATRVRRRGVEYLGAGQTRVPRPITVEGHRRTGGQRVTQNVTITITGTNDAPVVAVADVTGAVTER